jgi:hypothetical protein
MGHDMKPNDEAAIACRSIQSGHRIDTLPTQPKLPKNHLPLISPAQTKLQELEAWLETKRSERPKKPSPLAAK